MPHCHFVMNIRYNGVMRVGLRNVLHTTEIRSMLPNTYNGSKQSNN